MYSLNPSFFRLRGWRTRGLHGRPLVNHRRPRPFPPWESTPASGTTSFLFRKRCPMGHNASSILDYRGQFHVRKPESHKIRSTPKIQLSLVRLVPAKVQRASARSKPDGSLCTPCLDEVERANTESCIFGVERAMNETEPLIMGMAPVNPTCERRDGTCSIRRGTRRNGVTVQNHQGTHVEGGFPRRERPWAAVIPKRLAAEASWVPSGRTKKRSTWSIPNPQAPARKLYNRSNPLSAGLRSEPAMCPRGLRGVSAPAKEKAYLLQVRTFHHW